MRKLEAKGHFRIHPSVGEQVEAQALDAFRELWDRTVENATLDPESRLVTPAMVKDAIEDRLRDVLPKGAFLPLVSVSLNTTRTGFDVEIEPARVRRGLA